MEEPEKDYSLKKSFRKLGVLPGARLLVDQDGNVIDGVHSLIEARKLGLKIPIVQVKIENPAQTALCKLVLNKCRREMNPAEITQCLDVIGRNWNWKVKDFVEHLPFSYQWLMKYLPDAYKDAVKARAGAEGGKARAKALREARKAATRRVAEQKDTRQQESAAKAPKEEDLMKTAKADVPSPREFCERLDKTFSSHLSEFTGFSSRITTIKEKDLPTMFDYVNEKHDCNNCDVESSCDRFAEFYRKKQLLEEAQELVEFHNEIPALVPVCMKSKITNSP